MHNLAKKDRGLFLSLFSLSIYNKNFILQWKKCPLTADYNLEKLFFIAFTVFNWFSLILALKLRRHFGRVLSHSEDYCFDGARPKFNFCANPKQTTDIFERWRKDFQILKTVLKSLRIREFSHTRLTNLLCKNFFKMVFGRNNSGFPENKKLIFI